jgi:hypothetical protein
MFFFEKKNQKTFIPLRTLPASPRQPSKSFLLLFFKKEVLLFLFAVLVLLRMPHILSGRFWAEEGPIFFARAWTLPPWQALWLPYGGYLNLVANAAALAARWLVPLRDAPYVTITTGLLFQLLPPALLLTAPDPWLRPRAVRLTGLLLLLFLPASEEIWLQTLHCQFELLLCCALILALDVPPARSAAGWFRLSLLALAPLCGPLSIVLVPLFFARAAIDRAWPRLLQAAVLTAAGAVQVLGFLSTPPGRVYALHPLIDLSVVTLKHLAIPFLGIAAAERVNAALHAAFDTGHVPVLAVILPLVVFPIFAGFLLRRGLAAPGIWLFAAAAIIAGASYFGAIGGPTTLLDVLAAQRYAVVPQLLLELALLSLASRSRVAQLLIAWLLVVGVSNYWNQAPTGSHGPSWRQEVAAWQADPSHVLQIWPRGWAMRLSRAANH